MNKAQPFRPQQKTGVANRGDSEKVEELSAQVRKFINIFINFYSLSCNVEIKLFYNIFYS